MVALFLYFLYRWRVPFIIIINIIKRGNENENAIITTLTYYTCLIPGTTVTSLNEWYTLQDASCVPIPWFYFERMIKDIMFSTRADKHLPLEYLSDVTVILEEKQSIFIRQLM